LLGFQSRSERSIRLKRSKHRKQIIRHLPRKCIITELVCRAKLAFSCFKVGASVTTEVESAMKTISQHSGTNITMHSEGSRKHIRGTPENLLALKRKADEFYDQMSQQSYRRLCVPLPPSLQRDMLRNP
jgi:hypothetical protein